MPAPAPNTMMHLARRDDLKGALRLGIHALLLLAGGLAVAYAEGWWLVPAVIGFGLVQSALFAPFHETSHYTAFASRRVNAVVGWLVALPSTHNWPVYQAYHRAHHLHTQDPERDPELGVPDPGTLPQYLLRIAGWTYWRGRLGWYRDALRGDLSAYKYVPDGQQYRMIRALRVQLAVTLALGAAVVLAFGWWALLLYWVLPQLVGQVWLRMYLLTEHTGLPQSRDGLANTRTTLTTWLMRLLMWNMPYHAEHHLYPFIPFHQLPAAHGVLRGQLEAVQPGYARWQWGFLRFVMRKMA